MKKNMVVVMPVNDFDRNEAEGFENLRFTDVNEFFDSCIKHDQDKVLVFELTDFMDSCNNEELHLDERWISYIIIETEDEDEGKIPNLKNKLGNNGTVKCFEDFEEFTYKGIITEVTETRSLIEGVEGVNEATFVTVRDDEGEYHRGEFIESEEESEIPNYLQNSKTK